MKVFKARPNIKDGIYAITNIGVEILKYFQIFILFYFGVHSAIPFSHEKINQTKQDRYFDKTN